MTISDKIPTCVATDVGRTFPGTVQNDIGLDCRADGHQAIGLRSVPRFPSHQFIQRMLRSGPSITHAVSFAFVWVVTLSITLLNCYAETTEHQPRTAVPMDRPPFVVNTTSESVSSPAASAKHNDSCALTELTSVQIEPMHNGLIMAPVKINNVGKYMLVDTGGSVTQVWEGVARQMGLPIRDGGSPLVDINGNRSSRIVGVNQFGLGDLHAANIDLRVYPTADVNIGDDRVVGLLGPDMLMNFDIDLDFGSNRLSYFSQSHCDGKVQWQGSEISAIPFTMQSGHITIPVMIDGVLVNAIVDTGAAKTIVNLNTAGRVFNLTPQSTGMTRVGHMPGEIFAVLYQHTFSNMSFAGISVHSPSVTLMPDLSHGSLPDVIIGLDILRKLHLYMAFHQKLLYVSKAESPGAMTVRDRQPSVLSIAAR